MPEAINMVQTLPTYRSDQTFDEGILPRASGSRQHLLDTHAFDSLTEVDAIDPIGLHIQPSWTLLSSEASAKLFPCDERGPAS